MKSIKVASFYVDHTKLEPGVYLRHQVKLLGYPIKFWDIRLFAPRNREQINPEAAHVFEHMLAYHLRKDPDIGSRILSVNIMGCLTGFYIETRGFVSRKQLIQALYSFVVLQFPLKTVLSVPGMTSRECGAPYFYSIEHANLLASHFRSLLIKLLGIKDIDFYNPD